MSILDKSFNDYFSPRFLGLSFGVVLIPLAIFGIILGLGGSELLDALSYGAKSGEFIVDEKNHPIWAYILELWFVKYILISVFYALGTILAILMSLIIAMIVIGFLTPMVISTLYKKHYLSLPKPKSMKTVLVLKVMGKTFLKFVGLFIISLPFMFIPLINFIAINIPFFYLFYKMLVFDIGSNMLNYEEYKKFENQKFWKLIFLCLGFYFLSLIPIIGIFLQLFFAIYLTHFFFQNAFLLKEYK